MNTNNGPVDGPRDDLARDSGRNRDRDSRDRDRDRYRDRDYDRDRRDRDRDRDRERDRDRDRRDRDRDRDRERDRDRDRSKRSRSSRSRSRSPPSSRDAAPPTRRKKQSLWDKPPTGFETGQVLVPAPVIVPPTVLNPHQSRQARRIYVGNIPPQITDSEIAEFFNTAMFAAGRTVGNSATPVSSVQMNYEKNFAFLEFNHPEDATAGMAFDGITLHGYALKVRRPKDYKPLGDERGGDGILPNIVSTNVQEGPNKIFIGGLPAHLNEEQVKELLVAFGPLKSFNLVKDSNTGNSKGFAFFDYLDPDVTDHACSQLNGMKIGDKSILVQRANLGAKSSMTGATESILHNPTAMNFLNLQMPIAAAVALLGININEVGSPTRILQLMNIASPNELMNDHDYQDILDDVVEECRKYGHVLTIYMKKPQKPNPEVNESNKPHEWGVGRAFVEFGTSQEAARAQIGLGGRRFNGRTILSGFYSEERYNRKNFEPDPDEEREYAERFKAQQQQIHQQQQEQQNV